MVIFLQWIGAIVLAVLILVVAFIIIRLLWAAASRQWTKYSAIEDRVSTIETILFGNQESLNERSNTSLSFRRHATSYKVYDNSLYQKVENAQAAIIQTRFDTERFTKKIKEIESYRPTAIHNPEDLQ